MNHINVDFTFLKLHLGWGLSKLAAALVELLTDCSFDGLGASVECECDTHITAIKLK